MQQALVRVVPIAALCAVVLGGGGVAAAQPSQPSVTYELAIEGLSEKVTLKLESWSWGLYDESDEETTVDGKTKKPRGLIVNDLHFVIEQAPSTALLVDAMAAKKTMSKVTLRAKEPGSDKVFEIAMKDARLTSYNTGGSGYGGYGNAPMEQISLRFKTAKMTIGPKGKTETVDVTNPR